MILPSAMIGNHISEIEDSPQTAEFVNDVCKLNSKNNNDTTTKRQQKVCSYRKLRRQLMFEIDKSLLWPFWLRDENRALPK